EEIHWTHGDGNMMERINVNNYEAWLLDHSEGGLNGEELIELQKFCLMHPELEINLEIGDLPVLENEPVLSDFKDSLKKNAEDARIEELLSFIEGQLDPGKAEVLEERLR